MSLTIHKFVLAGPESTISMERGAQVLHVAAQGDDLCLWAEVDTSAPLVDHDFVVVPTGGVVPFWANYRGTALMYGGTLVWHVYEVIR